MLIDTHCHLYSNEFGDEKGLIVERAVEAGIGKFYFPAIDSGVIDDMMKLESSYPGRCFSMMGLHPCSVKENYLEEMQIVEDWLMKRTFAAIGETGLDFYWDRTFEKEQYMAFHRQMEWGLQYKLPVVIHSRNSIQESIDAVKQHQNGSLTGIFHCFTGDYDQARQIIDSGFYLGIGGVLTYKNSGLAAVLKDIPLAHIVLETDAPYLSPVPFRGKRNESSYLEYVAGRLAEAKGVSREEIERVTTQNAEKIFGS